MSNFYLFTPIEAHINEACTQYIGTTASNVASAISPVAFTLTTIYVMFWGWSMIRGLVNEPVMDGVHRIIRLCVILSIATNVGLYNQFVSDWLWQMPEALANLVSGNEVNNFNSEFLDNLLSEFYERGVAYWDLAMADTFPNFGFIIMALLIWCFGILVTAYVAYLLLLAKIALAVLLAVGSIFIVLTMFDSTKKFFDAWAGQVMNYIFINMLAAAVASLVLSITNSYLQVMPNGTTQIIDIFPLVVICLVSFLILIQVPSLASSLGGGVALSTLGTFGGAAGKLKGLEPRKMAQARRVLNENAGLISGQRLNQPITRTQQNSIKSRS